MSVIIDVNIKIFVYSTKHYQEYMYIPEEKKYIVSKEMGKYIG